MKYPIRHRLLVSLLLGLWVISGPAFANIDRPLTTQLLTTFDQTQFAGFTDFLQAVEQHSSAQEPSGQESSSQKPSSQKQRLSGKTMKLRVLMLLYTRDAKGGNCNQLAQGFDSGSAVLDACIYAEQTVKSVLLLGGESRASLIAAD